MIFRNDFALPCLKTCHTPTYESIKPNRISTAKQQTHSQHQRFHQTAADGRMFQAGEPVLESVIEDPQPVLCQGPTQHLGSKDGQKSLKRNQLNEGRL